MSGLILAAGEGKRLRPATLERPKALVPFAGVELLQLALSQLCRLCLQRIGVNCWHKADLLQEAAHRLGLQYGLDLAVSVEPTLLDTGGGIRRAHPLLERPDFLLVHNADVLLDYDLTQLIRAHLAGDADATLLLVERRGPCTVDRAETGGISDFRRPRGKGRYTFSGVQILSKYIFDYIPANRPFSIVTALEDAIANGRRVNGLVVPADCYWCDLGTQESYIQAHADVFKWNIRYHLLLRDALQVQARRRQELVRTGVRFSGALGLGTGLSLPPGTTLHNCVLWDGTTADSAISCAQAIITGGHISRTAVEAAEKEPDARILETVAPGQPKLSVTPLRKQGSGRRFFRLTAGEQSWIWCTYTTERAENPFYAACARFMASLGPVG